MLTEQDVKFIEKYVNDKYYDRKRLIKYLNLHEIVGSEVFSYCDRKKFEWGNTYSSYLDNEKWYKPSPVSSFIKRLPFYFFVRDGEDDYAQDLDHLFFKNKKEELEEGNTSHPIEEIYSALEYAFYSLKLPLNKIFTFWTNEIEVCDDISDFFLWLHHAQLCEKVGSDNYFPEGNFSAAYNEVREAAGLEPIIYQVSKRGYKYDTCTPFLRKGTKITFDGHFPFDENDKPIMKWIGIKATNAKSIKGRRHQWGGFVEIEISPDTVIHVLNYYNSKDDKENHWYQVYAGPQMMEFDYSVLKRQRKELGFTQQEVADAVGTSVRTYQKWESGETTPDGYFLFRLMNWLDITDTQDIVKYIE